jgi:phage antirepressor YoqD-like protein
MSDTPTTITPKDLAAELNIDPKRLRGWLRQNHTRPAEAKNTTWGITQEAADAARVRFAPKADDDTATVEA